MKMFRKDAWDGLDGPVAENARRLAALDGRINDWVAAAPILALLPALPPVDAALKRWAAGGYRVKTVLENLSIPTCLRKLDGRAVSLMNASDFNMSLKLDNPALGQRLSSSHWTDILNAMRRAASEFDGSKEAVVWCLDHWDDARQRIHEIKDYFNNHGPRWDWTPARIRKEHDLWVKSMRTQAALEEANRPENQQSIDLGRNPDEIKIDGVTCRALTTPGQLILEGATMQHCVGGAGFRSDLLRGFSLFYHLESSCGHSTVQFVRRGDQTMVKQHYSERNNTPPSPHLSAVAVLVDQVVVPNSSALQGYATANAGLAQTQARMLQEEYRRVLMQAEAEQLARQNAFQNNAYGALGQRGLAALGALPPIPTEGDPQ